MAAAPLTQIQQLYANFIKYDINHIRALYRLAVGERIHPDSTRESLINDIMTKYYGPNWQKFL